MMWWNKNKSVKLTRDEALLIYDFVENISGSGEIREVSKKLAVKLENTFGFQGHKCDGPEVIENEINLHGKTLQVLRESIK